MTSAEKAYSMLGNATLWDVVQRCHAALRQAAIPQAIVDGVAVCLHGYQRHTADLDVLMPASASDRRRRSPRSAHSAGPSTSLSISRVWPTNAATSATVPGATRSTGAIVWGSARAM